MSTLALAGQRCSEHRETRALYACQDCHRKLCHRCVATQNHGRHTSCSCLHCRGLVVEIPAKPEKKSDVIPLARFAFDFPLRGSNWTYFIGCTLLLYFAEAHLMWLTLYPSAGRRRGGGLWIFLLVFLALNLVQVIGEAARGSDKAPPWINPFGRDYVVPWNCIGMVMGAGLIAWSPVLAAWFWGGEASPILLSLALVFTVAYLPLALIAAALDCAIGFRLDRLPAELAKFGAAYTTQALGFAAVTALFVGGFLLALRAESWMLLLAQAPIVSYLALLSMRGLGELYRRKEERLAWF